MSLLSVSEVEIAFGGIKALAGVSLELNRGEILGLIGPNGAGKTTLFNCISGVLSPDSGRIRFEDRSITRLKPHERARRGIARTFQDLQLFGSMTVLENCQLPMDALGDRGIISDALRMPWSVNAERASLERARAVLHSLDLLEHSSRLAADLPVGVQRRVEIARALCMRPKLVLLDEPASGLDAEETNALAGTLSRIRDRFKVSLLLVDHDMSLVMRACDHIYVLDFGELIASGKPEQIRDDPRVIAAYLGGGGDQVAEEAPKRSRKRAPAQVDPPADLVADLRSAYTGYDHLLEVTGLSAGYGGIEVIRNININVNKAEVVACIGANGAGKTTTLRAISGVIKPNQGKVLFGGVDVTRKSADSIVKLGLLHIPQGRGLFPKLTVEETLRLASYSGATSRDVGPAMDAFPQLKDRLGQTVGTLSGGQQQMVAMARALLVKPRLLLLDEMSQGLAPAVVEQLFERLSTFRQQGIAIFLVEQFVDSALAIADRAYVFEQGTIAHQAEASVLRADRTVLASAYLGTAVEVDGAAVPEHRQIQPDLMEELAIKLPAELKRALQERAEREGKDPQELVAEMLGANGGKHA